jgi:hypothetical protein
MPNLGHFAPLALHLLSLSLGHSADVIRSCGAASEWSVEQRYLFIGFRAIETFRIFSLVGRGALLEVLGFHPIETASFRGVATTHAIQRWPPDVSHSRISEEQYADKPSDQSCYFHDHTN